MATETQPGTHPDRTLARSPERAPLIRFEHVEKTYPDGTVAVADMSLDVPEHELLTLVGPSGSGKSTLLRMVNRLVEPSGGRIFLDGTDVATVDAVTLRRGIGYVIQNVGLFPHRTVAQNVSTVPGLLGWDRARTRARVAELLSLVRLDPAMHGPRYPHELSGGQRQRVGVARALATNPKVMLMDEPFGAVDPEGRRSLQQELRRIHDEIGTTILFVTHDIDEAVLLGDRVAVFSQGGHLEQVDTPVAILTRPANPAVEAFIGESRSVRLLALARLEPEDLVAAEVGDAGGDASPRSSDSPGGPGSRGLPDAPGEPARSVRLGTGLDVALAALAGSPEGVVPVTDAAGTVVGTLTPAGLHAALRRVVSDSA